MSSPISGLSSFVAGAKEHLASDVSFVKNQIAQRNQEVKTAKQDYQSGDLAGAQQAFAAAKQDTQQIQADRATLSSVRSDLQAVHTEVAAYQASGQAGGAPTDQAALAQIKSAAGEIRADFTAFRAANTPGGGTLPPITAPPSDSGSTTGPVLNVQA